MSEHLPLRVFVIHRYFFDEGEPVEAYTDEVEARVRADYLQEHDSHNGYDVREVPLNPGVGRSAGVTLS